MTVTDEDKALFVALMGYDSETIDAILGGNAFTWEVEQIARHRIAERERVVGEIVAWLRKDRPYYDLSPLADELEAKFGGRDV